MYWRGKGKLRITVHKEFRYILWLFSQIRNIWMVLIILKAADFFFHSIFIALVSHMIFFFSLVWQYSYITTHFHFAHRSIIFALHRFVKWIFFLVLLNNNNDHGNSVQSICAICLQCYFSYFILFFLVCFHCNMKNNIALIWPCFLLSMRIALTEVYGCTVKEVHLIAQWIH